MLGFWLDQWPQKCQKNVGAGTLWRKFPKPSEKKKKKKKKNKHYANPNAHPSHLGPQAPQILLEEIDDQDTVHSPGRKTQNHKKNRKKTARKGFKSRRKAQEKGFNLQEKDSPTTVKPQEKGFRVSLLQISLSEMGHVAGISKAGLCRHCGRAAQFFTRRRELLSYGKDEESLSTSMYHHINVWDTPYNQLYKIRSKDLQS